MERLKIRVEIDIEAVGDTGISPNSFEAWKPRLPSWPQFDASLLDSFVQIGGFCLHGG